MKLESHGIVGHIDSIVARAKDTTDTRRFIRALGITEAKANGQRDLDPAVDLVWFWAIGWGFCPPRLPGIDASHSICYALHDTGE